MKKAYILVSIFLLAVFAVPIYCQFSGRGAAGLTINFKPFRERYEIGQPIDFIMVLTNTSERAVIHNVTNGPICDFWVVDTNGREVWRYSNTKSFNGRLQLRLEPGESKAYQAEWNQTDNQGNKIQSGWYTLFGRFCGYDKSQEPARVRIRIEDRSTATPLVLMVPVKAGIIGSGDVGKRITIDGILRQDSRGFYIENNSVKLHP